MSVSSLSLKRVIYLCYLYKPIKDKILKQNLAVPENNHIIGKYGNLRKKFLKSSKKSLYSSLMLTGKLFEHLHEIDEKAQVILDEFIKGGESNAPNKATNQMEWVGYMNNLRHSAEEVIFKELIYIYNSTT